MNWKNIIFGSSCLILGACVGENTNNTQDMKSNVDYSFSAKVIASDLKNTGWGAAENQFTGRIIDATVVEVYKGTDIYPGQKIVIKMKNSSDNCQTGSVCKFVAPYKHPSIKKYVYILDALLN